MKVKVNFLSALANYAGVESLELELPDGACYDDLLKELGVRFGSKFPEKCWDRQKNEFIKPISAIGSTGDIDTRETPLSENDEIHFLIPVSGGRKCRRAGSGGSAYV